MSKPMYSVSTLVRYIKETFDNDLNIQSVMIKGEISNFTNHRSGHWYFTLKDKKAKISCVMFASHASKCKMLLKEGMQVIVVASVSMYEASGSCQLYVTAVQVDGLGDLFLKLEQVKMRLAQEGLFEQAHKKQLPSYPLRIGVITAKTGAAIQDILTTIARRWPLADVAVYPSLVQGISATTNLIETLQLADTKQHEVILLARGGGAIEDLWCFNEEALARQVFAMRTPIVTGVGHETDTTLVDFVSDARAPTPTAAAELITPDYREVMVTLATYKRRLTKDIENKLQSNRQRLLPLKGHRFMQNPMSFIQQEQLHLAMHVKELSVVNTLLKKHSQQLTTRSHQLALHSEQLKQLKLRQLREQKQKLLFEMEHYRTRANNEMKEKVNLLDAYSPLKILSRGYNITYHKDKIVKSIHEVQEQDELTIRMNDGFIHTSIYKKEKL